MLKSVLILNWRCPKNPLSGGAEKVTLEHAKYWAKKGIAVTWLSGNFPRGKSEEIVDGVKIIRRGSPISIYFLALFLYWFKFNGNFDLVIDEIHGIPFLSPLWAWKSKKLAYIHEVAQEIWDEMLPFPINILGKLYEKIYFLFYKNISFLTGSNSTREDLIHYGINKTNITVLSHGLFLKPVTKIPNKEKNFSLLYVSRLVKMKGIEDAIRIFSEVIRKVPNAKFWIVGKGKDNYVKKLYGLVKKFNVVDSVIFFGHVSEKKKIELYRKSHFLLHTSVREGFGLVVIEANSQGTPVLAYDSPGLKDIIKNGVNGYLFEKENSGKIVKNCISLYVDKLIYRSLIKSSINESKKYNWKNITKYSLDLIKTL